MKENVPVEQAVTKCEYPLPPRVQEALGELVGVAREGLLALSVGVGLGDLTPIPVPPLMGLFLEGRYGYPNIDTPGRAKASWRPIHSADQNVGPSKNARRRRAASLNPDH